MVNKSKVLILGLGNTLFSDDGVGVHVVNRLIKKHAHHEDIKCVDGGTIGLNLLLELANTHGIIAIDAAEMNQPAGTLQVFENEDMDARLAGKKRTPHEVTLADLMNTALLTDTRPDHRALVAIQPKFIEWGDAPTEEVSASIENAEETILALVDKWSKSQSILSEETGAHHDS